MVKHPFTCKIITCGASDVGKTAFFEKLINNTVLPPQSSVKTASSSSSSSHNNLHLQNSTHPPTNLTNGNTFSNTHNNVRRTSNIGLASISSKNLSNNSNSGSSGQQHYLTSGVGIGNGSVINTQSNLQSTNLPVNSPRNSTNSSTSNSKSETLNTTPSLLNLTEQLTLPSTTKEDIYLCTVNSDRGPAMVRIHDTPGANWINNFTPPRHYCHFGDGFLLFFDLTNVDSFKNLEFIKNEIFKERERRDVHLAIVGMKSDLTRNVENSLIDDYVNREKIAYFECSITDRSSLSKPIQYIITKMVTPAPKSSLLSRRTRSTSDY